MWQGLILECEIVFACIYNIIVCKLKKNLRIEQFTEESKLCSELLTTITGKKFENAQNRKFLLSWVYTA